MTIITVTDAFKAKAATLAPSSGGAVRNYAIPADVSVGQKNGGLSFAAFPVTIAAQRLGNDAGTNRTATIGAGCYVHYYSVEVMVGLVDSDTINKRLEKESSVVVFSPYEAKAQLWLVAWHNALASDRTLGGVLSNIRASDNVIEDYRIGYLPYENPSMWGLWLSIPVVEEL